MTAYYNEFDPKAAAWLRELIKRGLIADGIVDERSITEVTPDDVRGFDQAHFFAGIGGWSYSLRLAGIPDDYPIWTASLPCQPFSAAGKQLGKADERHLLPHYLELVRQCRPNLQIGEQVEGAIRHGWLDDLQTVMEAEGYAVGHCVLGAHSVNAPHIRQRLYWVANANDEHGRSEPRSGSDIDAWARAESGRRCAVDGMADSRSKGHEKQSGIRGILRETPGDDSRKDIAGTGRLGNSSGIGRQQQQDGYGCDAKGVGSEKRESIFAGEAGGNIDGMGNTELPERWPSDYGRSIIDGQDGERLESANSAGEHGAFNTWANPEWLYCRDNKYRPVKPGLKPLVNGIPRRMVRGGDNGQPINANETAEARVMRLKGYGNAIVPQVAAEFISAFMEVAQ